MEGRGLYWLLVCCGGSGVPGAIFFFREIQIGCGFWQLHIYFDVFLACVFYFIFSLKIS